jgi:hypothetical protein
MTQTYSALIVAQKRRASDLIRSASLGNPPRTGIALDGAADMSIEVENRARNQPVSYKAPK